MRLRYSSLAVLWAAVLCVSVQSSAQESNPSDGLFLKNEGQWPAHVLYRFRSEGGLLDVSRAGLDLYLLDGNRGHALQWRLRGSNPLVPIPSKGGEGAPRLGLQRSEGYRSIVSTEHLSAENLIDGIALELKVAGGSPKYELHLDPGASAAEVVIEYLGAESIDVGENGTLLIETSVGRLTEDAPLAWQVRNGVREEIEVSFVVDKDGAVRFRLGAYDRSRALVIDPAIRFSTYLGGNDDDAGRAVVTDQAGDIYVVGSSLSFDYPTTPGAFDRSRDSIGGSRDIFVSKFDRTGTRLIWSTWISGAGNDDPIGGAQIAPDGNLLIAGITTSRDFPVTTGVVQDTLTGKVDGFVTKLDTSGRRLLWSTFYGGAENDSIVSFDQDLQGNIVIGGFSRSTDLTFSGGAHQSANAGGADLFVARLTGDGTGVLNGTWLGDVDDDRATDLVVGRGGETYLSGTTLSDLFPTTPDALSTVRAGGIDGVVAQLSFDLSRLDWSTYVGGVRDDHPEAITTDTGRFVMITGRTLSADFPNDAAGADSGSWFVTGYRIADRGLEFSTILSDDTLSGGLDAAFDRSGRPVVIGTTSNPLFPTTANARRVGPRGRVDIGLIRLVANGRSIDRAAVVGGSLDDRPARYSQSVPRDELLLTGQTRSLDFPLSRFPRDSVRNVDDLSSATDAFLLGWQFDELPNLTGPLLVTADTLRCETTIRDTFYVYNDGEASTTIFANQLRATSGPFRLLEPPGVTSIVVAPGDSVRYIVEYTNLGVGEARNEVLVFSTDSIGGRSPYAVPITASRFAPSIASSATTVDFGPVPTCAEDTITITLTNNGEGTVNVRAPIFLQGSGRFAVAPSVTFPLRIPVGASREVPIRFDPDGTGSFDDVARFTVQECQFSQLEVRLSGIGSEIRFEGLPDSVDLGEVPSCEAGVDTILTLVNRGDAPLDLRSVTGETNDVALLSPSGPVSIVPGDTVRIELRVTPANVGELVTSIEISFAQCDSTISLPIRVVRSEFDVPVPGVQMLDFGTVDGCLPGAGFVDRTFFVDNPSDELVELDDPVISSPFEVTSFAPPSQIEPRGRVPYSIRFRPSSEGLSRDTFRLLFRSGSCTDSIAIPLTGEYRRPVLERADAIIDLGRLGPCSIETTATLFYRNRSTRPLTIRTLLLPAEVTLPDNTLPATIEPGDSLSLVVHVEPQRSGDFDYVVRTVVDPCGDTIETRLRGSAEGVVVALDRRSIAFEPTLGCSPPILLRDTVRLTRSGTSSEDVVIRSARLLSGQTEGFEIENSAEVIGQAIPENGDRPIGITFGSSEYNEFADTLELILDPCGDTLLIPLSGSTRFPSFSVDGADFGDVEVNTTQPSSILIGNESGLPLRFDIRGLPPAPYSVDTNGLEFPVVVPPNGVLVLPVRFAPESTGQFTDSILLSVGEGCTFQRNIRLDGKGVNPVLDAEFCIRGIYLEPGQTGDTAIVEIRSDRELTLREPVDLTFSVRFDPERVEPVDVLGANLEEVDIAAGVVRVTVFGVQEIPGDLPAVALQLLAGEDLFTLVGLDSVIVVGGSALRPLLCDTSAIVTITSNCIVSRVSLGAFPSRILPPAPNPVGDRLVLTFQQLEDSKTTISIFDANGREVLRPVEAMLEGGEYTIEVDLSDLPSGLYLISMESGTWFGSEQFIRQ